MGDSLKGKVAFVTGAAAKRGMGHAVALRLAKEGADVVVHDKFAAPKSNWAGDEDWKGLAGVVSEIEAMGRKGLAVTGGVENLGRWRKLSRPLSTSSARSISSSTVRASGDRWACQW